MERHSKHFKVLNKSVLPSFQPSENSFSRWWKGQKVSHRLTNNGRKRKGAFENIRKIQSSAICISMFEIQSAPLEVITFETRKTEKHKPNLPLWSYKQNDNIICDHIKRLPLYNKHFYVFLLFSTVLKHIWFHKH